MIQANELRIGNNILLLGEVCTIECISNLPKRKEMYWIKTKEFIDTKIIHFKPIPLTEEILLKCGGYIYNGWDDMQFFRFEEFHLQIFELEIQKDGFYYDDTKIEFLHDLQNCYYFHANQKKELTFNNL